MNLSCSPGGSFFLQADKITLQTEDGSFELVGLEKGECGAEGDDHANVSLVFTTNRPIGVLSNRLGTNVRWEMRFVRGRNGTGGWEFGVFRGRPHRDARMLLRLGVHTLRGITMGWSPAGDGKVDAEIHFQIVRYKLVLRAYNLRAPRRGGPRTEREWWVWRIESLFQSLLTLNESHSPRLHPLRWRRLVLCFHELFG